VTFQLREEQRYNERGYFFYDPVGGTLEFRLRYATGPCTTTGTATLDPRASERPLIRLDFAQAKYTMIAKPRDLKIPVVVRCPGSPPIKTSIPFVHAWLDTGTAGKQFQDPGFTVLDDSFVSSAPDVVIKYEWHLVPSG
jgi:hypothetical protein